MTTIDEFRPRVRKGIAAIEAHESGATDRIDLNAIDVFSWDTCPLAQSIGGGDFLTGRGKLGIPPNEDATAAYGFSITYGEQSDHAGNYVALREAWRIELTAHRTARAALVAD